MRVEKIRFFNSILRRWNFHLNKMYHVNNFDCMIGKLRMSAQARSQDLERGGGAFLKELEKSKRPWSEFSFFLNQNHTVCSKIETEFLGKPGNLNVFSAQKQVISKKKRSSPKLRLIFRPQSEIWTFFPPKNKWSPKKKGLHRNWD